MCPFCDRSMEDQMTRHLVTHHSGEMVSSPEKSATAISAVITQNMAKGYRLVTLNHLKRTVRKTMWRDLHLRSRLHE